MEFEPDIGKLEKVVTRLLEEYDVVKTKCEQLTLDLAESLAQVAELKEQKTALLNDKDTVHSRVSTILEKLGEWEGGLGGEDENNTGKTSEIVKDGPETNDTSGQLFSMGSSSQ